MILVTGATGLVGSHLLYKLTFDGNKVRAIKRKSSNLSSVKKIFGYYCSNVDELFDRIEWKNADLSNASEVDEIFDDITEVYHAAAFVSFNPLKRKTVLENIEVTANIVKASLKHNIRKFCHVSSVAALGKPTEDEPVNETMIWSPSKNTSTYSVSKFHSEMEVWRGIEEGLNAVIVNPTIIIGPGNWDKSSAAIMPTIDKGMKYYTPGGNGFVDVRDVAEIMIQLMKHDITAERFILNSENMTYKDFFSLTSNMLNKPAPTILVKRWMANLGWRVERIKCLITGAEPRITKETVHSGFNTTTYSNEKIKKILNFNFISIHDSLYHASERYLAEKR